MPIPVAVPFAEWRKAPNTTARLCLPAGGRTLSVVNVKQAGGRDVLARALDGEPAEVKEAVLDGLTGDDEYVGRFLISNARIDSYKDSISVAGWELADFRRNPVVLFAHDADALPIGKDVGVHTRGEDALHGITKFAPPDMNPLALPVARMLEHGYLNATSVGFVPLEYEFADERDDGMSWTPPVNFKRQRLAEYSVVPVPANPDALVDGRSLSALGIDLRPVQQWAEKLLDERGSLVIPRTAVEGLARSGRGRMAFRGGVVLLSERDPVLKAEVPPDVPATPVAVEPSAAAAGAADCKCPACGWQGPSADFAVPAGPPPAADASTTERSLTDVADVELIRELARRGLKPRVTPPSSAPAAAPAEPAQTRNAASGPVDNGARQGHHDARLEERALRAARAAVREEMKQRYGRLS